MDKQQLVHLLGPWTTGQGPLYRRLTSALHSLILRGDIAPGTRLPAERRLAEALAISRSTVVSAYRLLEQGRWIELKQGSGAFVCSLPFGRTYASPIPSTSFKSPWHLSLAQEEQLIDFSVGTPGPLTAMPASLFHLSGSDIEQLMSQRGYAPQGWLPLRQAIASYYRRWNLPTSEEQILVTTGAQQAISLIATLYLQRGERVLLENPTYFGTIDVLQQLRAQLLPLTIDTTGINRWALRKQVREASPRLLIVSPTFQNPTGMMMPLSVRQAIANLSMEAKLPVLEDLTFADVLLEKEGLPPIAAFDTRATVLSIGSLNKLFWSGLRVGWVRGPQPVIERLVHLKETADLGSGLPSQSLALQVLQHMDHIRQDRRHELQHKLQVMTRLLSTLLPDWTWQQPDGGYFLWLRIPSGNAPEFAQVALRSGVIICPGTLFSVDASHQQYVRLPFLLNEEILQEGMKRLAQAWETYLL
ncbi:PLP-dependent aminotransferase family protein [Ktedonospora formicarum]|uniref:Putative GntR-family regulatory protein n=1 Tax=Ktedonospora formicarum TaxID=2778364 RepID=A0A8J3IDJ9_9CHLR|nr:PLP-dependent aminotransferase family protein [Ktedonospora formicarum]GHO50782.1 putative GntR-family regulatory protein [Ktedonospora formicarum]